MDHKIAKEKVLIIADSNDAADLYSSILKHEGYIIKVLEKYGLKYSKLQYEEMLKDILDFNPHLTICDFFGYTEDFEFLLKIHEIYGEDEVPKSLLILPRSRPIPEEYYLLINEVFTGPVHIRDLIDTVKRLCVSG